jgi:hypothetical protein
MPNATDSSTDTCGAIVFDTSDEYVCMKKALGEMDSVSASIHWIA